MEPQKLMNVLLGAGALLTLIAFLWWASFYGKVTSDLGSAVPCLFSSGGECGLVRLMARFGRATPYSPFLLWAGLALLGAGWMVRISLGGKPPQADPPTRSE